MVYIGYIIRVEVLHIFVFCFIEQRFMTLQSGISESIFRNFSHPDTSLFYIQGPADNWSGVLRKGWHWLYVISPPRKDKIKFGVT